MKKKILGFLLLLLNIVSYAQFSVNEGFEDPSTPAGWSYSGFERISSANSIPCSGDGAILSHLNSGLQTASALYSIANSNGLTVSISFKYRVIATDPANPAVNGNIKVEYSASGSANNFQLVGSQIDLTNPSAACVTFTGTVPGNFSGGSNRFRITANNVGSGDWKLIIDDVVLTQTIPCLSTMVDHVTNLTHNSAVINWFISGNSSPVNNLDVYYSTNNTLPTPTTPPTISGVSGLSLLLSGLLPHTTYKIYMRAHCNSGISSWGSGYTLTTPCSSDVPYNEDFEQTGVTSIPPCTAVEAIPYYANSWRVTTIASGWDFAPGKVLYVNFDNVSVNTWWYTPKLSLQAGVNYVLKFKKGNENIKDAVNHRMKVAYGTAANSTSMTNIIKDFTAVQTTNAETEIVYFTPVSTGEYFFGFNGYTPTGTTGKGMLNIDDISINISNCLIPDTVSVGSITQNSAVVNWNASVSNPVEGYDLYYSTSYVEPTESTIPSYQGISGVSQNLSSLTPGKRYYVWVRSRCSSSQFSDWKGTSFFAGCEPSYNVPYIEDFEESIAGSIPNCTILQSEDSRNNWTVYNNYYYSSMGGNSIYWPGKAFHFNDVTNTFSWFFTPGINLESGKQYKISYKYGKGTTLAYDKLKVAYGASPASTSMTTVLADYQSLPGSGFAEHIFTVPVNGIYYFGFDAYANGFIRALAIDNIKIIETNVLAVEDINKKDDLNIYPNPFTDVLNITDIKNVKSIKVYDLSGKLIKTLAPSKELDLKEFYEGVYLILLQYKDGTVKTFKAIKNK
ncbi:Fibronectin type III domain protein [Chryseobacterium oranimense G311]|uniref:fibronectin type III domain-containing protein n=1 Tax=Chryseobacterium oranimense TaxID=421058 RepID=UPI0005337554|nr:fibronectin type III domain-containing protein [Chryseobacterium oranimense]CEJ69785.1 Fibronectin type III domain protein [Chryseobacterium oranimense G311]